MVIIYTCKYVYFDIYDNGPLLLRHATGTWSMVNSSINLLRLVFPDKYNYYCAALVLILSCIVKYCDHLYPVQTRGFILIRYQYSVTTKLLKLSTYSVGLA